MSGVEETSIKSTLSLRTRLLATSAARLASDWLSFTVIDTSCFLPATVIPFLAKWSRTAAMTTEFASPNGASGPVSGLTKPILMASWLPLVGDFLTSPHAVSSPDEEAATPARPASWRKRRVEQIFRAVPPRRELPQGYVPGWGFAHRSSSSLGSSPGSGSVRRWKRGVRGGRSGAQAADRSARPRGAHAHRSR